MSAMDWFFMGVFTGAVLVVGLVSLDDRWRRARRARYEDENSHLG